MSLVSRLAKRFRRALAGALPARFRGKRVDLFPAPAAAHGGVASVVRQRQEALERCLTFLKPDLAPQQRQRVRDALTTVFDCGYLEVVERICADIRVADRRLLEVGCGQCWHAPLLLARGARCFVGVDQYKDFTTKQVFHRQFAGLTETPARMRDLPLPLDQFLAAFQNIEVHSADFLNWQTDRRFDAAYLLTVTEHLEDVRAVFQRIVDLLDDGGLVYFSHHNYYCWNGHHMVPRTIAEYDANDPAMRACADCSRVVHFV